MIQTIIYEKEKRRKEKFKKILQDDRRRFTPENLHKEENEI